MLQLAHSSLTTRALAARPEAGEIARLTHGVSAAASQLVYNTNNRITELEFFSVFHGNMRLDEDGAIEPAYDLVVASVVHTQLNHSFIVVPDTRVLAVHFPRMDTGKYQVITSHDAYERFGPDSKRNMWDNLVEAVLAV